MSRKDIYQFGKDDDDDEDDDDDDDNDDDDDDENDDQIHIRSKTDGKKQTNVFHTETHLNDRVTSLFILLIIIWMLKEFLFFILFILNQKDYRISCN